MKSAFVGRGEGEGRISKNGVEVDVAAVVIVSGQGVVVVAEFVLLLSSSFASVIAMLLVPEGDTRERMYVKLLPVAESVLRRVAPENALS